MLLNAEGNGIDARQLCQDLVVKHAEGHLSSMIFQTGGVILVMQGRKIKERDSNNDHISLDAPNFYTFWLVGFGY
jgi:hypothetical protein